MYTSERAINHRSMDGRTHDIKPTSRIAMLVAEAQPSDGQLMGVTSIHINSLDHL